MCIDSWSAEFMPQKPTDVNSSTEAEAIQKQYNLIQGLTIEEFNNHEITYTNGGRLTDAYGDAIDIDDFDTSYVCVFNGVFTNKDSNMLCSGCALSRARSGTHCFEAAPGEKISPHSQMTEKHNKKPFEKLLTQAMALVGGTLVTANQQHGSHVCDYDYAMTIV